MNNLQNKLKDAIKFTLKFISFIFGLFLILGSFGGFMSSQYVFASIVFLVGSFFVYISRSIFSSFGLKNNFHQLNFSIKQKTNNKKIKIGENKKSNSFSAKTIIFGIAIGFLICIGIPLTMFIITVSNSDNSPVLNEYGEDYKIDLSFACMMAQKAVKNELKSPASAQFQNCVGSNKAIVNYLGNQTYLVGTYVDSQNSFGALLRTAWIVNLKDLGDNRWSYLDVTQVEK